MKKRLHILVYNIRMLLKLKKFWPLVIFLTIYYAIALFTYKQFGITDDENVEYNAGKMQLQYYLTGEEKQVGGLAEWLWPTKSPYFRGYPALLTLLNPEGHFEKFHLLNMIFGSFGFIFMYLFILYETKKTSWATLALLGLFFVPRFVGDIPANPKDIPFATIYLLRDQAKGPPPSRRAIA